MLQKIILFEESISHKTHMPTESLSRLLIRLSRPVMQALGYSSQIIETSEGQAHYYQIKGRGKLPPIVVLHGFGTHAAEMYPLLQQLRGATQQLIAVDLPMHGLSQVPQAGVSLSALDSMFFEALDQVLRSIEPAILFGNSLGGLAALRYYLYHPDNVRLMVLSSPAGAGVTQETFESVRHIFENVSQEQPEEVVARLYNAPPFYQWFIARDIQVRFARQELKELMNYFRTEYTFSPEDLQKIAIPTLIVWGKQDRILENQLQFFKDHAPANVRFLEPHYYSHAPYLEHARELAHQLRSFALLHCT